MRTSFLILALAATVCTASPIGDIEARKSRGKRPGIVQYYYDDHCKNLGGQEAISTADKAGANQPKHGGPYGVRSAAFSDIGDLGSWAIQEGKSSTPPHIKNNPKVGDCIYWAGGVFAIGSAAVVVH